MGTALKTLTAAREWLDDPERWLQGNFYKGHDQYKPQAACLIGACDVALGAPIALFGATHDTLMAAVEERGPYRSVATFNDDESTTHADVLAVLEGRTTPAVEPVLGADET